MAIKAAISESSLLEWAAGACAYLSESVDNDALCAVRLRLRPSPFPPGELCARVDWAGSATPDRLVAEAEQRLARVDLSQFGQTKVVARVECLDGEGTTIPGANKGNTWSPPAPAPAPAPSPAPRPTVTQRPPIDADYEDVPPPAPRLPDLPHDLAAAMRLADEMETRGAPDDPDALRGRLGMAALLSSVVASQRQTEMVLRILQQSHAQNLAQQREAREERAQWMATVGVMAGHTTGAAETLRRALSSRDDLLEATLPELIKTTGLAAGAQHQVEIARLEGELKALASKGEMNGAEKFALIAQETRKTAALRLAAARAKKAAEGDAGGSKAAAEGNGASSAEGEAEEDGASSTGIVGQALEAFLQGEGDPEEVALLLQGILEEEAAARVRELASAFAK